MDVSASQPTAINTAVRQCYRIVQVWNEDCSELLFNRAVWKEGNDFFYSQRPGTQRGIDWDSIVGEVIPKELIFGPVLPDLLQAPAPLSDNVYVKIPHLTSYDPERKNNDFTRSTVEEARVLEVLSQHPHPNITEYYGVVVEDGLINGLALKRYSTTIWDARKRHALDVDGIIDGLAAAVDHLHRLGFVHNDINPRNIMLDDDSRPILIDFDSCVRAGERLVKGGTPQWSDPADPAVKENDWNSVELVKRWLKGEYTSEGET